MYPKKFLPYTAGQDALSDCQSLEKSAALPNTDPNEHCL